MVLQVNKVLIYNERAVCRKKRWVQAATDETQNRHVPGWLQEVERRLQKNLHTSLSVISFVVEFIAMKRSPLTLLLLVCSSAFAQHNISFKIDGFSNKYYGLVSVRDTADVFKAGTVKVFDKTTKKELFHTTSDELTFDLHNGQAKANILEAPYGEQSLIIYEDFNFDGVKDFALMDGQNSCYHGPSFQVWLAQGAGFKRSEAFTRLAQEYCGMFVVNQKDKVLETMTKSGCCWHQFSRFKVENGQLKTLSVEESSLSNMEPYFEEVSQQTWVNGKEEHTLKQYMGEQADTLFSFTLAKNGKQVVVFHVGGESEFLFYALCQKDGSVEFSYPEVVYDEKKQENVGGVMNYGNGRLAFKNEEASYEVYDEGNGKIGVKVLCDGKNYVFEGLAASVKGGLDGLKEVEKKNLKKVL
ncbi:XAC2610-related protein [Chitinophaga sancti]|uniref:Uncharacterized protein n=1 Tax=Chitinophaga sancti TaxID=1004 RepID=A0A1K1MTU0_9BACT|nr:hypothetical protein [Chitinophaga sancti]WQD62897.1 hypothetical protein U0033_00715 [Chitinophaga sancti]WQG91479.1 hypothetical protein SR876_08200 [Chitinophaga sancti]SFW25374.1 hypothetical protein SAMN05661012_00795 [Chitinophaga sancti]